MRILTAQVSVASGPSKLRAANLTIVIGIYRGYMPRNIREVRNRYEPWAAIFMCSNADSVYVSSFFPTVQQGCIQGSGKEVFVLFLLPV
jgi:hypothetical protein